MDELLQSIRDLPLATAVPVSALILAGLVLWVAGRRVLRGAFAIVGGVLGAAGGFLLADAVDFNVPSYVAAIIAGLLVACIAILVYRLALASALVVVCGLASPLAIATFAELQQLAQTSLADDGIETADESGGEPPTGSSVRRLMQDIDDANAWLFQQQKPRRDSSRSSEEIDAAMESLDEELPLWRDDDRVREMIHELRSRDERMADSGLLDHAERLDAADGYSERVIEALRGWWERNPEGVRPAIIAAAFIGVLTGLILATFAPGFSAILVSAFGGSLAWLGGTRILLGQMGGSIEEHLPSSATAILAVWLIISLLGVAIQWIFRPGRADTRS